MPNKQLHNLVSFLQTIAEKSTDHLIEELEDGVIGAEAIDFNLQQLRQGQLTDLQSLPDYSECSVQCYGKTPGAITLHDEGDFYDSIQIKKDKNSIEFISTDKKYHGKPAYLKKYMNVVAGNGTILGLTKRNLQNIEKESVFEVSQFIREKIKKI